MFQRNFFVACLCILLISCQNANDPVVVLYPLAAGNAWMYSGVDSFSNYRPDSPGTETPASRHWTARTEIVALRTLRDTLLTWEIKATSSNVSGSSTSFFQMKNDTLFLRAYNIYGRGIPTLPKSQTGAGAIFNGTSFASTREMFSFYENYARPVEPYSDSIAFEEIPPKVLFFPLRVGAEWTVREGGPLVNVRIVKKIVGTEMVATNAGSFLAYKIRLFYDFNGDGKWDPNIEGYDFVCTQGLIKRTLILRNMRLTSPSFPEGYATVDEIFESIVTSLSVR